MKRVFIRGIVASLALGVAGAVSVASAQEKVRIQVYPGSVTEIFTWVTVDQGFCKARNLDCTMVTIPSGPLGLQALASSSIEVSEQTTSLAMAAAARGNDVQMISAYQPNNPYALNVGNDIKLAHLSEGYPAVMQDLKGLKIGISARGSGVEEAMTQLLVGAGLSPDDITYVAVGGPATAYPALLAKQIDAALMWPPFAFLCEVSGSCQLAVDLSAGQGPDDLKRLNGAFNGLFAARDWVKSNPETADNVVKAYQDAEVWMNDPANFDAVMKIVRNHFNLDNIPGMDDEAVAKLVKWQLPRFGTTVSMEAVDAVWESVINAGKADKRVDEFVASTAPRK